MKHGIRHYYPNCTETAVYACNTCKKCKIAKTQEYAKTDRGKITVEKCVAKQTLHRKIRQLEKILQDVEKELAIVSSCDSTIKQDLEQIQSTLQRLCIQKSTEQSVSSS